jgi:hypothetical protein
MQQTSKYFCILIAFCSWSTGSFAQKYLFDADSCKADRFPTVTGQIYHRGYGNTILTKEQLEIHEDGKPMNFTLTPLSKGRSLPKNKRVLLLIENHYQQKGVAQRSFFANVVSSGIYNSITPGDEFMIATFDWQRTGRYIFPAFEKFTDDTSALRTALRGLGAPSNLGNTQEGADINSALDESLKFLSPVSDSLPTAIVLFSDDLDNSVGRIVNLDIRNKALEAKIPIYAISYAMYPRYNPVMRDEICTPTFGKYFISLSHDISASGKMLKEFLDEMINDYQGSTFSFSYQSPQEKNEQKLNLEFSIRNSSILDVQTVMTPSLTLSEKISRNRTTAIIIAAAALLFISLLVYFIRKTRQKQKKQDSIIKDARSELQTQSELMEKEKERRDAQIQAIHQQQADKEREKVAEEKRKEEAQRLKKLMLARGVFPSLHYVLKDTSGKVDVSTPVFTIGRDTTNSFFIQMDTVSRQHATIFFDESGRYTIIDHNSSNGTFVNGEKIKQSVIKSDDIIQIGGLNLIFHN